MPSLHQTRFTSSVLSKEPLFLPAQWRQVGFRGQSHGEWGGPRGAHGIRWEGEPWTSLVLQRLPQPAEEIMDLAPKMGWNMGNMGEYPLVNVYITMENHHF